jgi:hypothetical protein
MGDRDVLAELPRRAQGRLDADGPVLTGPGQVQVAGQDPAWQPVTGADPAGRSGAEGSACTSCRTFAGLPSQVREARHWLAGLVAGHQAADDALLALSELAANAVSFSLLSSRVVICR